MESFIPGLFNLVQNSQALIVPLSKSVDGQSLIAPIELGVAESPTLIEAVCRFRYQVYIKEMNRSCKFDPVQQMIRENFDELGKIFTASDNEEIVGTVRGTFSDNCVFEHQALFDFDRFESRYPGRLMFAGKMMVAPSFRKSSLFVMLASQIFAYSLLRGVEVTIIDCNDHLIGAFAKLGFREYKGKVLHPEYGIVTPMVLFNQDRDWLANAAGPFLSIYDYYKSIIEQPIRRPEHEHIPAS